MPTLLFLASFLLATASPDGVHVRPVDSPGLVHAPLPDRPEDAEWDARSRVVCHMSLQIAPDGTVARASADGCKGEFRRRAEASTRTWTFQPVADAEGLPQPTRYDFDLTYRRLERLVREGTDLGPVVWVLPELPPVLEWALDLELACRSIVHVDASGLVEKVTVEGCGELLVERVQTAVHTWRFAPVRDASGEAVPSLYPVTLTFRSSNLTQQALTVDVPGLLSIPLRAGPPLDLPPLPEGVTHLDEPLPVRSQQAASVPSIGSSLTGPIRQLGLESARFRTTLLLTVNHKGKVTELVYLDGPPELEPTMRAIHGHVRFDRSGVVGKAPVRFVREVPLRVRR